MEREIVTRSVDLFGVEGCDIRHFPWIGTLSMSWCFRVLRKVDLQMVGILNRVEFGC